MVHDDDSERRRVQLKVQAGERSAEVRTYPAEQVAEHLKTRLRAQAPSR